MTDRRALVYSSSAVPPPVADVPTGDKLLFDAFGPVGGGPVLAYGGLQIQASSTLSTTSTGQINLPNNASARFQVAGVSVSANVTAANLGTLTAGLISNADALHTHPALVYTLPDPLQLTGLGLGVAPAVATTRLKIEGSGTGSTTYGILITDSGATDRFFVRDDGATGIGIARAAIQSAGLEIGYSGALGAGGKILRVTATLPDDAGYQESISYVITSAGTGGAQAAFATTLSAGYTGSQATYAIRGLNNTKTTGAAIGFEGGAGNAAGKNIGIFGWATGAGVNIGAYFTQENGPANAGSNSAGVVINSTSTSIPNLICHVGGVIKNVFTGGGRLSILAGTSPSAGIHLHGEGASSATTAMLAEDSASTHTFSVRNDGRVAFGSTPQSMFLASGFLGLNVSPTSLLHVRGTDTSGSTTGFLVENSTPTAVLAITNDGRGSYQSHAGSTGAGQYLTGKGQTTNATQTAIATFTLPDASVYAFEATVEARESAGADRATFQFIALVYREGGGATIQGTVVNLFTAIQSAGAALWAATFTVSGNDVRVSVTGAAATTINWSTRVDFQRAADNS